MRENIPINVQREPPGNLMNISDFAEPASPVMVQQRPQKKQPAPLLNSTIGKKFSVGGISDVLINTK